MATAASCELHAELLEHGTDLGPDRGERHVVLLGDLVGAAAVGESREHQRLAGREFVEPCFGSDHLNALDPEVFEQLEALGAPDDRLAVDDSDQTSNRPRRDPLTS